MRIVQYFCDAKAYLCYMLNKVFYDLYGPSKRYECMVKLNMGFDGLKLTCVLAQVTVPKLGRYSDGLRVKTFDVVEIMRELTKMIIIDNLFFKIAEG